MTDHKVVPRAEWVKARSELLAKEKAFTRARDALSQERREPPRMSVETDYSFEGSSGKESLSALFDGRSRLIVYHFMFDPSWEAGCRHCSFWADNFDPVIVHLNQRDVSMVAVSRAPYAKLAAYQERMSWRFKWLSSLDSEFNRDFVSPSRRKSWREKGLTTISPIKIRMRRSVRVSRCSPRMRQARASAPTPPTRAVSTW